MLSERAMLVLAKLLLSSSVDARPQMGRAMERLMASVMASVGEDP